MLIESFARAILNAEIVLKIDSRRLIIKAFTKTVSHSSFLFGGMGTNSIIDVLVVLISNNTRTKIVITVDGLVYKTLNRNDMERDAWMIILKEFENSKIDYIEKNL